MKFLKKGFTLIELLVVIAIIGILAALILTNIQGVRQRARDSRRKADLNSIRTSLRIFYNDQKSFPSSDSAGNIIGCGSLINTCTWGTSSFAIGSSVYMNLLPLDPLSSASSTITYEYHQVSDDSFALVAKLENASDSDIADSQSKCSVAYNSYASSSSNEDATLDYVLCE